MKLGCLAVSVACVFLAACGAVDSSNISEMTSPELKAVSDQRHKQILNIVVVIFVVIWLLQAFGLLGSLRIR